MVLATGSVALPIPGVEFGDRVVDTWGAWSLPEQPKKIAVVGAGASGCEIASAYGALRHRGAADRDARPDPARRGQGHGPGRRARLQEAEHHDLHRHPGRERRGRREARSSSPTATTSTEVDYLCIAGGRAPDVEALGLAEAGVELEENGKVKVDEYQRTSNQKVYAIGDLVGAKALAHKASEEASSRSSTRPASRPTRSTRTSSPAPPSATRRSPASASPRRPPRRPATTSRSAS